MATQAVFAGAPMRAGLYESFYLRAVSPEEPMGVWIRHTVHKAPGRRPRGSIWCTVFDARRGAPFMHKLNTDVLRTPAGGWIAVGESTIGPGRAQGACGEARWSLSFASQEPELRHLSPGWLYRTALPRTKLTSPAPTASFDGVLELAGRTIELHGWPGMVGHNWGSQHAERWIWLHGVGFREQQDAWLDLAIGRVKLAGRTTPWVASGALFFAGKRHQLGGIGARGTQVAEGPTGCSVSLTGANGLKVHARAAVPALSAAGWRYADPSDSAAPSAQHDVVHCSIAAIELTAEAGGGAHSVRMHSEHGGAYELGMRERDHGVPIAPFSDG
jgi:hypothetical protein